MSGLSLEGCGDAVGEEKRRKGERRELDEWLCNIVAFMLERRF